MFKESDQIEKFEPKVWLSSPTMHGEEFEFLKEAYETNWMSTVGRNIDEVEHQMAEMVGLKYAVGLSAGCIWPSHWSHQRKMHGNYALHPSIVFLSSL